MEKRDGLQAGCQMGHKAADDQQPTTPSQATVQASRSGPRGWLQICLYLTGGLLFVSKLSDPSVATLLSPVLCIIAAVRIRKGMSRGGFIGLMILPVLTAVMNLLDPPMFVFEFQSGIAGLALLVVSFFLWLGCPTPNSKRTPPPLPKQTPANQPSEGTR